MSDIKQQFSDNGFFAPLDVMPESELLDAAEKHQQLQAKVTAAVGAPQRFKLHLLDTWLADLVCNKTILDAVEKIIGPDILCWSSDFFVKPPCDSGFVSMHQDCTYAGLTPHDGVVNVWLALTPSTTASGCLQVVSGSHKLGQLEHKQTTSEDNMLFFGQTIDRQFSKADIIDMELRPGQASLHHMAIAHGSQPNTTNIPRIGFVLRYMRPDVKQSKGPDSATLVRGQDTIGHFEHEPLPVEAPSSDSVSVSNWTAASIEIFKNALAKPSALG